MSPRLHRSIAHAAITASLLTACGGSAPHPARAPAASATCLEAAAAIDARAHGGSLLALTDALAPLAPYYRSLATEVETACTAGAWSPEVRACMVAASSDADLHTCEDALSLAQRHTLADRIARVIDQRTATELRDQMCTCADAACTTAISARAETWGKAMEGRYRDPKQVPAPLMQAMLEMASCEARHSEHAWSGGGGVDGIDAVDGSLTGVPECDRFLALQDRYFACDKVPQRAKDAMRQSMDQQKQAWQMLKDPNVPAEAKRAASDGCRQGSDALQQSASAMGCTL